MKKNKKHRHRPAPDKTDELLAIPENADERVASQINARTKIIEILTRVDTRQSYTDKLLERELEDFSQEDRGLITEVVNGVMRWQYRLDWYLKKLYVGEYNNLIPDVKNNLRSSAYQLMYLDKVPPYAVLNEAVEIAKKKYNQKTANLVNAILRNFLRQQKKLAYLEMKLPYPKSICVRYSHPDWLVERWVDQWGLDDTLALCESNNRRPKISIRFNLLKGERAVQLQKLNENGITHTIHSHFPDFIQIDNFADFRKLGLLKDGLATVQDVSTGIPVMLLDPQPGDSVLDMCAAPGGKACFIAEKMQNRGQLVAMEKHQNRARMLDDNFKRMNVNIVETMIGDATELDIDKTFDRILIDAPCSGLGVLNKRVDLRWKRSREDIEKMQYVQLALLETAVKWINVGGVIVYSTCTIEPDENESVIDKFLKRYPNFVLDDLRDRLPSSYLWQHNMARTFPQRHNMDGSYAVRLLQRPK